MSAYASKTAYKFYRVYSAIVGSFLANTKHSIWVQMKQGEARSNFSGEYTVKYNDEYYPSNIDKDLLCMVEFDKIAMKLSINEISTKDVVDFIELKVEMYPYVFKNDYFKSLFDEFKKNLDYIKKAPPIVKKVFMSDDLYRYYFLEYERLTEQYGLSEFADFLGWDNKKLSAYINKKDIVPLPLKELKSSPIWSVGQIESFVDVINFKEKNKKMERGRWERKFIDESVSDGIEVEIIDNQLNFAISDSISYITLKINELNLNKNEQLELLEYVNKISPNRVLILNELSKMYLELKMYAKAKKVFGKIVSIYESHMPEDLVNGNECEVKLKTNSYSVNYLEPALNHLSLLEYMDGNKDNSIKYLMKNHSYFNITVDDFILIPYYMSRFLINEMPGNIEAMKEYPTNLVNEYLNWRIEQYGYFEKEKVDENSN